MHLIEQALRARSVTIETATTDDDGAGGRVSRDDGGSVVEDGATRRYFRKTTNPYKVSISLARWLLGHARDYDLIHIHALFSFTSTAAAWAARRAGVPYVLRPLGTLASYGMTHRRPWLKRLSFVFVEGPLLRHAAAVHFTSAMEWQEALSLGIPMRAAVIPLAVEPAPEADIELLYSSFPQLRGKRWVLYLSRMDPKKNVEGLLRAIVLCAVDMPEMRWLLAGDGESGYVAQLHGLARQLGIEDKVIWAGHLEGEQKAAALAHAALFVLPSYSENFGIAAAEALEAGLPVVLGKGVALSALAVEAGAGIASEPAGESIAAAMKLYLLNPQARALAASNARALATREFSLETMGARLLALYEAILLATDKAWIGDTPNA